MIRTTVFLMLWSVLAAPPSIAQQLSKKAAAGQAMGARYEDQQWESIVPELGADSPQIAILRIDPVTQATHLLIRVPKQNTRPDTLAQRQRNPHGHPRQLDVRT